jgi:hypothetical protein
VYIYPTFTCQFQVAKIENIGMEFISPNVSSCAILLITRGVSHCGLVIYIKT